MSVVVMLSKGRVTHFVVEDTKAVCGDAAKQEPVIRLDGFNVTAQNNNSYCSVPFCANQTDNEDGKCDPKVFVSFLGSDRDGNSLISSSSRWMALRDYNLPGLFANLMKVSTRANTTDNYVYDLTDITDPNGAKERVKSPPPTELTSLTDETPGGATTG